MTTRRQLHFGAFMRPSSLHTGAWRYPGAWPDSNFNLDHLIAMCRRLEAAKFDAFFMADHLAVLNMPPEALKRSHTVTSFEPMTLLSALAMKTERIGLIATASTTFEEPYHVARRFASLDHISGGRAAWNVVTTSNPDSARNFNMEAHPGHDERYVRAREYVGVVKGLWDSFADDAFIRDVESGVYFDPERMHVLDHHGDHFNVRGPLNIARPVQGHPVIVQAGTSDSGRDLAAEVAEVIFGLGSDIPQAQAFRQDIHARMAKFGRAPEEMCILPGAMVWVGDTVEEAQAKRDLVDSKVHYDSGIRSLSIMLGHDVSAFDPDGPLPELPPTQAAVGGREQMMGYVRARPDITIRELASIAGSYSGLAFVGTPEMIADSMQEWLEAGACDGFNVMFPYIPQGLEEFCDRVVPILQDRGIYRTEYEGATLRENLGLKRPDNRFFR